MIPATQENQTTLSGGGNVVGFISSVGSFELHRRDAF